MYHGRDLPSVYTTYFEKC